MNLVQKTDSANAACRKLYDNKSKQYEDIRLQFDLFKDSTSRYINYVSNNLHEANSDLLKTKTDLNAVSNSVTSAIVTIGKANRKRWKERIVPALLGFSAAFITIQLTK